MTILESILEQGFLEAFEKVEVLSTNQLAFFKILNFIDFCILEIFILY